MVIYSLIIFENILSLLSIIPSGTNQMKPKMKIFHRKGAEDATKTF